MYVKDSSQEVKVKMEKLIEDMKDTKENLITVNQKVKSYFIPFRWRLLVIYLFHCVICFNCWIKIFEWFDLLKFFFWLALSPEWFGYFERLQETWMVKAIHYWKPISKSPIGKPNTHWEDDVTKDVQNLKCQTEDLCPG